MNIALCICTRNRPEDVVKALSAAACSLLPPAQILVSDDSDEPQADRTRAGCDMASGVTYIRGPRRGLSANRNHCLDHLNPSIEAVAYVDDDVVIRPDFLGKAVEAFRREPPKTIITGRENKNGADITPHNCSFWGHQEVVPHDENDYHTVVINTTLFPKNLFVQARFDEALRYGSEEADMCAQAEALGYRIRFCPALVNDHYPSPVNRTEYSKVVEASRLYSTYKRYKWLERNQRKASAYALLAPLHIIGGVLKSRRLVDVPAAVKAVCTAMRLARHSGAIRTETSPLG
jgi:GT2 family glycosyltransferase